MKKFLKVNTEESPFETTQRKYEGYRQTKLGCIPEGWTIISLGELGEFSKGKGVAKKDVLEDIIDGHPCVRYAEIYTLYHYNTEKLKSKINQESAENSNPIDYGDILFAGSGETLEDIGKSVAYLGKETAYAGGDIIIPKQNNQDARYLGYLLNNDVVKNQLFKIGQGHSVVHIYSSGLKKVQVPLPPLPEQQKIANILNTWDKAIATQEQLIAQKQELKKGLMQQLLTGKKRFAGFEGEWEVMEFDKIAERAKGKFDCKKEIRNKKCLELEHLNQKTGSINGWTDSQNQKSIKNRFNKGQILFGKLRPYLKKFWLAEFSGVCSSEIWVLDAKKIVCTNNYLFYLIQTNKFIQIANATSGSKMPRADWKYLSKFPFGLPELKEQHRITEILKSLDLEVRKLKESLIELESQKQGLMQQLLTGKKRVKL